MAWAGMHARCRASRGNQRADLFGCGKNVTHENGETCGRLSGCDGFEGLQLRLIRKILHWLMSNCHSELCQFGKRLFAGPRFLVSSIVAGTKGHTLPIKIFVSLFVNIPSVFACEATTPHKQIRLLGFRRRKGRVSISTSTW